MHEFTNDSTNVFDYTFEQLQAFDVGMGERIPSLQQVIELINKRMYINIEIKTPYKEEMKKNYNYKACIDKVNRVIR